MRALMMGTAVAAAAITNAAAVSAAAERCEAAEGRAAQAIAGEVTGANRFRAPFGPDWTFELAPETHGWRIQIVDQAGLDLSQMTPPLHGPNPRELYGWHFRNAANTGPNEGDVNAAQTLRAFGFDPRLSGTAGWRPPAGGEGPADQPGRGVLFVRDMGLADLTPGEQARMVFLKFDACLNWPSEHELSTTVPPEVEEQIGGCGLNAAYELSPHLEPISLSGDFDGDGVLDVAAPIVRKADGKRAIAVCRAGTHLDLLGLSGGLGAHLVAEYFDRIDWWRVEPKGPVFQGGEESAPPTLMGDAITMGKEDSSSVLLYWGGSGWTSYWQGD